MSDKPISATIRPPKRVEMVNPGKSSYFDPGQFGYVISYTTHPGMYTEVGPSKAGDLSYLVSKSKSGRGGATWFTADALRFTTRAPKGLTAQLSDEEKIAVDLLLQGGNGTRLAELVPDSSRRAQLKMIASELRSLRAR